MPIDARTSGGVYKVVSKILTADGSEIGKVMDSTGRIIYEASRLITVTGVPPISFTKSIGKPLISWDLLGNTQQTGTPSPDNIIMPDFCGVRTWNLFDENSAEYGKWVSSNGSIASNAPYGAGYDIKVGSASKFAVKYHGNKPYSYSMAFYDSNGNFLSRVHKSNPSASYDAFVVPGNAVSARFQVSVNSSTETITPEKLNQISIMLNSGTEPLPYEPYGYKIPFTCAGQTVPVYLGQTQTVRRIKKLVLTGEETGWTENSSGTNTLRAVLRLSDANENGASGYCSHTKFVTSGVSRDEELAGTLNGNLYLRIRKTIAPDITAFKQWLADEYANGAPVCVWYVLAEPETAIVNEPLAKIGDYADELHSIDAGVSIPTANGNNTLTVDTDLPPSSMTIVYKGR